MDAYLFFIQLEGDVNVVDNKNPGQGIVEAAKKAKATLIVTGTRGQNPLTKAIFGSVSDYLLHHSPISVAVCKLPK